MSNMIDSLRVSSVNIIFVETKYPHEYSQQQWDKVMYQVKNKENEHNLVSFHLHSVFKKLAIT